MDDHGDAARRSLQCGHLAKLLDSSSSGVVSRSLALGAPRVIPGPFRLRLEAAAL
jgi:hypothetical protein